MNPPCATCAVWSEKADQYVIREGDEPVLIEKGFGVCRRHAPTTIGALSNWPVTLSTDFCGEHLMFNEPAKPAETPEATPEPMRIVIDGAIENQITRNKIDKMIAWFALPENAAQWKPGRLEELYSVKALLEAEALMAMPAPEIPPHGDAELGLSKAEDLQHG